MLTALPILALVVTVRSILGLLIVLALVGVGIWALTLLPMPEPFKKVIMVVGILVCLVVVAAWLGVV